MAFPAPTATYHHESYTTIDSSNPELTQSGKNVALTGAGSGIGQAIALSFAKANVSNLALVGRTLKTLEETKALISSTHPKSETKVHIFTADIADASALNKAFTSFATTIAGPIHILLANAGSSPGNVTLGSGSSEVFTESLIANAIGTLNTLSAFLPHAPSNTDASGYRAQVIHTSTAAIHVDIPTNSPYAVGKLAAAKYVQAFAVENPDIWVVNFHPGIIDTPMAAKVKEQGGMEIPAQDELSLPADWTVWAAAKAHKFVSSGRFLWAHWDVQELEEVFKRVKGGELGDGEVVMGGLPVGQRFTIGLSGWLG